MISLLLCSRVKGNENHNLLTLLDSLQRYTSTPGNLEVLIKFDIDDTGIDYFFDGGWIDKYPFVIKTMTTPRRRGYLALHTGYAELLTKAKTSNRIIGAVADDFICICQDWDLHLINSSREYGDLFIVHGRPHGPANDPRKPFGPTCPPGGMEELFVIDEAPFWSRGLLEITGRDWLVSFTDAWTYALEHYLWLNHEINRTVFVTPLFSRTSNPKIDSRSADRWHTARKENFDFIASDDFKRAIQEQAKKVSNEIENTGQNSV